MSSAEIVYGLQDVPRAEAVLSATIPLATLRRMQPKMPATSLAAYVNHARQPDQARLEPPPPHVLAALPQVRRLGPEVELRLVALAHCLDQLDVLGHQIRRHDLQIPCAQPLLSVRNGDRSRVLVLAPPFLGPGFRLGARWDRLVEAVKTRKKREKTRKKRARYGHTTAVRT